VARPSSLYVNFAVAATTVADGGGGDSSGLFACCSEGGQARQKLPPPLHVEVGVSFLPTVDADGGGGAMYHWSAHKAAYNNAFQQG